MQNQKISDQVKRMMKTYKDYNYFLENKSFIEYVNNKEFSEEEINRRKWYCSYVDQLLSKLQPIEKQILEHVYMNDEHPSSLHLSLATYYLKRNKLFKKLKDIIFLDFDFDDNKNKK